MIFIGNDILPISFGSSEPVWIPTQGGGGSFNPADYVDVAAWFDGTTLAASIGGTTTAWVDSSGNGNDAFLDSGDTAPSVVGSGGYGGLSPSGSTTRLLTPNFNAAALFAVVVGGTAAFQTIGGGKGTTRRGWAILFPDGNTYYSGDSQDRFHASMVNGVSTQAKPAGLHSIYCPPTPPDPSTTGFNLGAAGAGNTDSIYWVGSIHEYIFCATEPDSTQIANLFTALIAARGL